MIKQIKILILNIPLFLDVEQDINKFEIWLHNTENRIENLKILPNWSLNDLADNLKSHKVCFLLNDLILNLILKL
jgi:hypothetical protein